VADREVHFSETFLQHATAEFPPGGSADGKPSWTLFESGPLKAFKTAFGRNWEKNTIAEPGTGIRVVMTHALPFFPAMTVYAVLVVDEDGSDYVELLDIVVDHDYFNMIEDDPPG
jgi:hypothetical protein